MAEGWVLLLVTRADGCRQDSGQHARLQGTVQDTGFQPACLSPFLQKIPVLQQPAKHFLCSQGHRQGDSSWRGLGAAALLGSTSVLWSQGRFLSHRSEPVHPLWNSKGAEM